jgi:hypothetical protein
MSRKDEWDDWYRVMHETDRRVCMKFSVEDGPTVYAGLTDDGLQVLGADGVGHTDPFDAETWVVRKLRGTAGTVTPVMRDETPFDDDEPTNDR